MIEAFLAKLVPAGRMVIAARSPRGFRNIICEDLDAALETVAMNKLKADVDIYFGLGSLAEPFVLDANGKKLYRVQSNIAKLKSFWIDIDVDPNDGTKYPTVDVARDAILKFVADYNMPAPMVVFSGGGLHVYWPLTKAVSREAWQPLAEALKAGLIAAEVKLDRTRTADASSVLRVVGTQNIKRGTKVKVLLDCAEIKPSVMKAAIIALPGGGSIPRAKAAAVGDIPGVASSVDLGSNTSREFPPCDFDEVMAKCAQVGNLYLTGGISEPHWHNGLALARHMTDPEGAAIAMSKKHDDYSKSATLFKLHSSTKERTGPTLCKTFQDHGPKGLCESCPKFRKISTPAQLGQPEPVKAMIKDIFGASTLDFQKLDAPDPYRREAGMVWFNQKEKAPMVIIPQDMYPIARLKDDSGDRSSTTWRAHRINAKPVDIPIL